MLPRLALSACLSVAVTGLAFSGLARAQSWPAKPIRVVVPFGPGSGTDIVPRIVLESVGAKLGQSMVIENRPGAGSTTGTAVVAKADPDGYTLLVTSSALTVTPAIYDKLTYDPVKDLAPVAILGGLPSTMIVNPSEPYKTLAEFVAFAKSGKKPLNFASVGVGSGVHFAAERFRLSAGYEAAHVPFKGGSEAITEVIAGRIDYYMCPVGTAIPFIRDGKLRALAVSRRQRLLALPDVPTTLELGFKESDYEPWVGMLAPAGTPRPILERLAREIAAAVKEPAIAAKLEPNGIVPMPLELDAFGALIAKEINDNAVLAKALALKPASN
jgi:tripartite-type tricarboxylate transporter receptor subunit TctC